MHTHICTESKATCRVLGSADTKLSGKSIHTQRRTVSRVRLPSRAMTSAAAAISGVPYVS